MHGQVMLRLFPHLACVLLLASPFSAQAQQQSEKFAIQRFVVEGNSLLPEAEVNRLTQAFLGPGREYGDIQRALEALEAAYRQRGYAAVQVYAPEQEITSGVVRLQVMETLIGKVRFEGKPVFFDSANLRHSLPALQEGKTPNALELSSQIGLANENPAKQVDVVLGLGEKEGTVDAKINLAESAPRKFFASLDNTGTASTGKHRLSLGIQDANLWNRDHVATLAYITSPEKPSQVGIVSLSYRIPFYDLGGALDLILAKSNVDAATTITTAGPLSFTGKGDNFSLRYTHSLPRAGETGSKLMLGWDYKAYDNICSLGSFGAAGCGAAAADITLRPLTITYSLSNTGIGQATDASLSLIQNIPGGSQGDNAAFAAMRPSLTGHGAKAGYTLLRASASHIRLLAGDWQVRAALNAQWAAQALLAQEQLGLAGSNAVRGFAERDVARDIGAQLNLEAYTPDLAAMLPHGVGVLRLLAFVDAATGYNKLLAGETQAKRNLASAGLGLRYSLGKDLSARLDLARVLTANGAQVAGDVKTHFTLSLAF